MPVDAAPSEGNKPASTGQKPASADPGDGPFAVPGKPSAEYTDGRLPGQWETKYPAAARRCINQEACVLAAGMIIFCFIDGILLGMSGQTIIWPLNFLAKQPDASVTVLKIDIRLLSVFFTVGAMHEFR